MSIITLFNPGDRVISQSGVEFQVVKLLGEGGQGQVYHIVSGSHQWALKYYTKESFATEKNFNNLKNLIEIGSPSPSFLWPVDLVITEKQPFFGYIMSLRPDGYYDLNHYMKRRINPTFFSVITAAYNLAESFSKLHAQGLCYRDISLGNVFFNPDNGDVLICDNDNVCYNNDTSTSGIGGTPGFVAPEIVMGKDHPNRNTDLYSLSVLLFHLLFISHPLDGVRETQTECWDFEAEKRIHGSQALFIFDPVDSSNHPDPDFHQNALLFWNIYPNFIKNFFIKAFTKGLFDPHHGRVRENEWKLALIQLRDSILYCYQCGYQGFYDSSIINNSEAPLNICWNCKNQIFIPPRINIGNNGIVMLNSNTRIYQHHLNPLSFDFTNPVAQVSKHPTLNMYGLQNLGTTSWIVTSFNGNNAEVPPMKNVPLKDGITIDFGTIKGEIRV